MYEDEKQIFYIRTETRNILGKLEINFLFYKYKDKKQQ